MWSDPLMIFSRAVETPLMRQTAVEDFEYDCPSFCRLSLQTYRFQMRKSLWQKLYDMTAWTLSKTGHLSKADSSFCPESVRFQRELTVLLWAWWNRKGCNDHLSLTSVPAARKSEVGRPPLLFSVTPLIIWGSVKVFTPYMSTHSLHYSRPRSSALTVRD